MCVCVCVCVFGWVVQASLCPPLNRFYGHITPLVPIITSTCSPKDQLKPKIKAYHYTILIASGQSPPFLAAVIHMLN